MVRRKGREYKPLHTGLKHGGGTKKLNKESTRPMGKGAHLPRGGSRRRQLFMKGGKKIGVGGKGESSKGEGV